MKFSRIFLFSITYIHCSLLMGLLSSVPSRLCAQEDARAIGHVRHEILDRQTRVSIGFDAERGAGLFVGVSKFTTDDQFAEVSFAVDDAVDIAYLMIVELELVNSSNTIVAVTGEPKKEESRRRLGVLRDRGVRIIEPTTASIYQGLALTAAQAGENGLLIYFFATHGFSDQGTDYLVTTDSIRRRIVNTGIAVPVVMDEAGLSRCPRRIVLIDACRERLTKDTRAGGASPESAMGVAFSNAIANAKGQVVLSGAIQGGYSYDNFERQNGVFTAAVLDGLHGNASSDSGGFVTATTLADYIDQSVTQWVRENRPGQKTASGIERSLGGGAATLPLAISLAGRAEYQRKQALRLEAIDTLKPFVGRDKLSGSVFDEMSKLLSSSDTEAADGLLSRIDILQKIGDAYIPDLLLYWETAKARRKDGVEETLAASQQSTAQSRTEETPEATAEFQERLDLRGLSGTFLFPQAYEKRTEDNVYHFTEVIIPPQVTLVMRDPDSTGKPVIWYVTGRVEIAGVLNLDGESGGRVKSEESPVPAPATVPGYGGFGGGYSGSTRNEPTDGLGPGAGRVFLWQGHISGAWCSGGAGHATPGRTTKFGYEGNQYGDSSLRMLVGGSGGGGTRGYGMGDHSYAAAGGAGGGAILIASNESIQITGRVSANGGLGGGADLYRGGDGSGGAIYLAAPKVTIAGSVEARGGYDENTGRGGNGGSHGRIRVECQECEITGKVFPEPATGMPWWMGTIRSSP